MEEDELDTILSHFDCYKFLAQLNYPKPDSIFLESLNQPTSRFATPVSDSELQEAKLSSVPKNTDKSTSWAVNIWKEWSAHRHKIQQQMDTNLMMITSQGI